ncbi:GUN4 protein [Rivularia sp. PCC 7116]|uniref:GUN4 domain-containing protein n=1 Tax=Rivularia sp. PCC 7116 TaxID=373994 RepID=UPI00029ED2FB|nr:GUN4 domain-containing protein [Rivularia sp. PCC 7116]AFY54411.1 GUN4 protein [Rivularia sp. PCC 7116]
MRFENGKQRRDFYEALLNAFPAPIALEQMLSFGLNKTLCEVATGANHSEVVFRVVTWAETQGKLQELINAASEYNPGNPQLRAFCQQWVSRSQLVEEPVLITPQQIKEDDLRSEKAVDYTRLRDLLKAAKWKEADEETLRVMLKAAGVESQSYLYCDDFQKILCTDLRTIDQLWVKYSNGRFGFSLQKRIWESVKRDYGKFGDRVGWRKGMFFNREWLNYLELTFSPSAPDGHLPSLCAAAIFTIAEAERLDFISFLEEKKGGLEEVLGLSSLASRLVKFNI